MRRLVDSCLRLVLSKIQIFRKQKSERLFLFSVLCYTENSLRDGGQSPKGAAAGKAARAEKIFRFCDFLCSVRCLHPQQKEEKGWLEGSAGSPSVRRAIICWWQRDWSSCRFRWDVWYWEGNALTAFSFSGWFYLPWHFFWSCWFFAGKFLSVDRKGSGRCLLVKI